MKQVFADPNTELFFRMAGGDLKPDYARYLESKGIEVNPRMYLSQEKIDDINGVGK